MPSKQNLWFQIEYEAIQKQMEQISEHATVLEKKMHAFLQELLQEENQKEIESLRKKIQKI